MRYTPEIEAQILAQIVREPDRAIILPRWAYWAGDPQPWVYIDRMPTRLIRHLYGLVVGELHPDHGLTNPPGVDPRNVNPRLAVVTPSRRSKVVCQNGHRYTGDDYIENVGHECQTCRADRMLGKGMNVGQINKAKKTCPQGHKLVRRPNGKRRCFECDAARARARRAREREEERERKAE